MGYMILAVAGVEALIGLFSLATGKFPTAANRFTNGIGARLAGLVMMAPLTLILIILLTRPHGPVALGQMTEFFDFLLQRLFLFIGFIVGFPIVAFFLAVLTDYAPASDWVPNSRRRFDEDDDDDAPRRRRRRDQDDEAARGRDKRWEEEEEEKPVKPRRRRDDDMVTTSSRRPRLEAEEDEDNRPASGRKRRRLEDDEDRRPAAGASMGKIIGIILLILALVGGGIAGIVALTTGGGVSMVEVESAEGNFKIQMPGTPKQENKEIPGLATAHVWMVESRRGAYFANYSDMPIPANEPDFQIQNRLSGSRDGMLNNIGARLVSEKNIDLHGWPGRDIRGDIPGKGALHARIFLVQRRLYQIMALGENSFVNQEEVANMLASFQLIHPPLRGPVAVGPGPKIDPGKDPGIPPIKKEFPKKDPPKKEPEKLAPGVWAPAPEAFENLRVSKFVFPAQTMAPCLVWAPDGHSFYAAEQDTGIVRRIALNGFKEEAAYEVKRKVEWLSLSGKGLLVTCANPPGVYLLDATTLEFKNQATLKDKTLVLSAPALDKALALDRGSIVGWQHVITLMDLPSFKAVNQIPAKAFTAAKDLSFADAVLTPDGKHLVVCNGFRLYRFTFKGNLLLGEEMGAWIGGQGSAGKLTLSTDGGMVWMTNRAGNHETKYGTLAFAVGALQRPAAKIEVGAFCDALAWDAPARQFYAQNHERSLIVCDANGAKIREYDLRAGDVRLFLVHPEGRKLLLLGNQLYYLELPSP